jgi:hypothetical protein
LVNAFVTPANAFVTPVKDTPAVFFLEKLRATIILFPWAPL